MNQAVFFALFPKGRWIILCIGIVLWFLDSTIAPFAILLVNFGLFLLSLKVATVIHELGHLVCGRLVGGVNRRIVLGWHGQEIYRNRIFGVLVIIISPTHGGYVTTTFDQHSFLKLRHVFLYIGGALFNVLLCIILYEFSSLPSDFSFGAFTRSVDLAAMMGLANALRLSALIPYKVSLNGTRIPTDGLRLLQLPFVRTEELIEHMDKDLLLDAAEMLETKDYQNAWALYSEFIQRHPDTAPAMNLNLSVILLKTGRVHEALEYCTPALELINTKPESWSYIGYTYNHVAWIHLVLNNIAEADHFSELAFKNNSKEGAIRHSRGCVLVEKGELHDGMYLLFETMDWDSPTFWSLSSSVYLMLAYHRKGDFEARDKHRKFVEDNFSKVDQDDKIIFQRHLGRIENQTAVVN